MDTGAGGKKNNNTLNAFTHNILTFLCFAVCGDDSQFLNNTSGGGISGCPTDISIDIPSASTAPVKVSWKEPSSASTDLDSTGILSKSHSPGSSFPVNSITTVTYVFNDTIRSECSFNIEINGESKIYVQNIIEH